MFSPLYNDEFSALLEAQDTDTDSEAMAKLLPPPLVRLDGDTERGRPALKDLEAAAAILNVTPVEVFSRIVDDVVHGSPSAEDDEPYSARDFLIELLEWIVFEQPGIRTAILGGFAAHRRMRAEDRQTLIDSTPSPSGLDAEFEPIVADLEFDL